MAFRRTPRVLPVALLVVLLAAAVSCRSAPRPAPEGPSLRAVGLRCNGLTDPAAIDPDPAPSLSWRLESRSRGEVQTAYRVLVASSPDLLAADRGDLWDSGRVEGGETLHVRYSGRPLPARARCWWKVRTWGRQEQPSPWSAPGRWAVGLGPGDWQARFVSSPDPPPPARGGETLHLPPARHYRRELTIRPGLLRATAYATALGLFELEVNGRRAGDAALTPGWTDYRRRLDYMAFDLTDLLATGRNAVGAIVADGWYAGYVGFALKEGYGPHRSGRAIYGVTPALLVQVELEYPDGREIVGTDGSWKVTGDGPIREADLLMGEHYDAQQELAGWSSPGYDDRGWEAAVPAEANGSVRAPFFDGAGEREVELGFVAPATLRAFPAPPVRRIRSLQPVAVTQPAPGVHVVDLGENVAGVARIALRAAAGTAVRLRFGEALRPDGRVWTDNLRRARATDTYVARGAPEGEVWAPRFTYHGFRYVELEGWPGSPGPDAVTGLVMHADTPPAGAFAASDPLLGRLWEAIVRTHLANSVHVPTDCPQRDERMAWLGDAQVFARTAVFAADVAASWGKWLVDVADAQLPSGAFPDFAPHPYQHGAGFSPGWMDAGVVVPWVLWRSYGDLAALERQWPAIARFMAFRQQASPDGRGVAQGNEWGDWVGPGERPPVVFLDAVHLALDARLAGEMALALGRRDEAQAMAELHARARAAFLTDYLGPGGTLAARTQAARALAVAAGLLDEPARTFAGASLAQLVRDNGGRLATGFLGTRALLPVLTSTGHHDLAVSLARSRRLPSWGYMLERGATTIWERWDGITDEAGLADGAMNSLAHPALGSVGEWLFRFLAGIESAAPGYGDVVIRPYLPVADEGEGGPLQWVTASYESIRGTIAVAWRRRPDGIDIEVRIPANVTATVHVPAADPSRVTESGLPLDQAEGVRVVGQEGDRVVVAVGAGAYRFTAR